MDPNGTVRPVENVSYELRLSSELTSVHLIFHISMLKKFIGDLVSVLPFEGLGEDEGFYHDEVPVEILYHQVKKWRTKEVVSVKIVLWRNHLVEGATWEARMI